MGTVKALSPIKIKDCDKHIKNKFSYKWLEKKVNITIDKDVKTVTIGDDFVKIDLPGQALCKLCSKHINYGSRGIVALGDHLKSTKHIDLLKQRSSSYRVDAMFKQFIDDATPTCSNHLGPKSETVKLPQLAPMCDRVSNAEAIVLGCIAEHSMPLSYAPILINLAKTLSQDQKALSELHMDRTTASYKLNYGLAQGFQQKLISKLQCVPFSLNLDEATSKSNKKVLTIIAAFYDADEEKVMTEHLTSVELTKTDSDSVFKAVSDVIEINGIPWTNLISVLMDSCNVMRGRIAGVEAKIREQKAPHLLDIDGDACHHLHNCSKKFCAPFNGYLERLYNDLHNDLKYSQDLVESLKEICEILDIRYITPERFIPHRWLSAYEISLSANIMYDAYIVFYYSFLNKEDKETYQEVLVEILEKRSLSEEARKRLYQIQKKMAGKKMTEDGKERKKRIYKKVLHTEKTTKLQLSFYQSVLQILKKYVCSFQCIETRVHQIHEAQYDTVREFLACFMKAEMIATLSPKALKTLNLETEGLFLKQKDMFIGIDARNIIISSLKDDIVVKTFLDQASAGYVECAKHMLKTLPINNSLLKALACIDPCLQAHTYGVKLFQDLALNHLNHLLTTSEQQMLLSELNRYAMERFPASSEEDVVAWWTKMKRCEKYPLLCRIAVAVLSIFHGPAVESSFNVMGDIISEKSTSMLVATYSSYQTVKYALKARHTSALKLFERKDPKFSPVDRHICIQLRMAAQRYKQRKQEKIAIQKDKLKKLKVVSKQNLLSKRKIKETMKADSDAQLENHVDTQKLKARKREIKERLVSLAKKRKMIK